MSDVYDNSKGFNTNYIPGDYNVICDICGKKKKRSECAMAYGNGIIPVVMSCLDGCADANHPLNYPPPVIFDGRPVPDARPDVSAANSTYLPDPIPSFMKWGSIESNGTWGSLNYGNSPFNLNPMWTWGDFQKPN